MCVSDWAFRKHVPAADFVTAEGWAPQVCGSPRRPRYARQSLKSYQAGHAYEKLASAPDVPSAADDRGFFSV